jgi:hypothetical protein
MSKNPIVRNVALIIVFCAVALVLFTENVRTVQILGLFACGAVAGAALCQIKGALNTEKKAE